MENNNERTFSYDANGYLDTEQTIINNHPYITDYDFDPAGNLRAMIYPTGQRIDYLPDSTDVARIRAVILDPASTNQTLASNITYLPFGPISFMTFGNTLQLAKTFDQNYQIRTLTTGTIINRTYIPDNVGNIQTITNHLDPTRSQTFSYDAQYRLTSASGIYGTLSFTYDKTGNRLSRTHNTQQDTYTYLTGTNQLDAISGAHTNYFNHDIRQPHRPHLCRQQRPQPH